jgi:phosphoribosyl 1,2-cyclic phosphodiesterase
MSLAFCVLGSGSRGNTTLLITRDRGRKRCMLIDCGLSMRTTKVRLAPLGLTIDDITDVLMTHFDCDHFHRGWVRHLARRGVRVHVHKRHRGEALARGLTGREIQLVTEPFELDGGTHVEPVLLAHDDLGTTGFVLEHDGVRMGFATDLGRVPDAMLERFVDLHALAIESNYDRRMQVASDRPDFLKRRIMSGRGHLSNDESIDAVRRIQAHSRLAHVVPLHLSQQCNDPRLVKRTYEDRAPRLLEKLTISSQRTPTPLLRVRRPRASAIGVGSRLPGEQLAMF